MEKINFIEKLLKAFAQNALEDVIKTESAEGLYEFSRLLTEANNRFNLTAITDDDGIILKHFVDCATVTRHIPTNSKIIDVGCGAGFPSMPIAILRKDISVTSLDSTAKKIHFINELACELGLENIKAIASRAEDHAKTRREFYDVAISRAVARLNILDEICLPLVKVGGRFIAMKSSKGEVEYKEAESGVKLLGGELIENKTMTLEHEGETITREIFIFNKTKHTPSPYPRNYSQILKKPL